MGKKERVSVILTEPYLDGMDRLVESGLYIERQALIRDALRLLLGAHGIPPCYPEA